MKEKEEDDDLQYDDEDSVQFIKNHLPENIRPKYKDDDITYIIDLIYEFYDSKGFMDDDADESEEVEFDEDELIAFVVKNASSDGVGVYNADDIASIVKAELDYCESIGMFDE